MLFQFNFHCSGIRFFIAAEGRKECIMIESRREGRERESRGRERGRAREEKDEVLTCSFCS